MLAHFSTFITGSGTSYDLWGYGGCRTNPSRFGLRCHGQLISSPVSTSPIRTNFISECCVQFDNARVSAKDLKEKYLIWCKENGEYPMKSGVFKESWKIEVLNVVEVGQKVQINGMVLVYWATELTEMNLDNLALYTGIYGTYYILAQYAQYLSKNTFHIKGKKT